MWKKLNTYDLTIIRNAWRLTIWRLRRLFRLDAQWPIIWGEQKLKSFPSQNLLRTLNEAERKKLADIVDEMKLLSCCYNYFPETLSDTDWARLLKFDEQKLRLDHIKFCRKNEVKQQKLEEKKQLKKKATMLVENTERSSRFPMLLLKTTQKTMLRNRRAMRYIQSEILDPTPALIIDSRFLADLSLQALSQTMCQFNVIISENYDRLRPWPLYFCNYDVSNPVIIDEQRRYLSILSTNNVYNPTMLSDNYLNIFSRSDLIYLSPHAENDLEEIDGTKAYILGGIVDRLCQKRLHPHATLLTAREDNVEAYKLPIDKYVKWKSGSRSLTLPAVSAILYDVYTSGGDWEGALRRHIPVRNLRGPDEKNAYGRQLHAHIHDYNRRILDELNQRKQLLQQSG